MRRRRRGRLRALPDERRAEWAYTVIVVAVAVVLVLAVLVQMLLVITKMTLVLVLVLMMRRRKRERQCEVFFRRGRPQYIHIPIPTASTARVGLVHR